jgi:hypothetical protein
MGAAPFECQGEGSTVSEAYNAAVEEARYWHGHAGYSGTIAEKDGFTEFTVDLNKASEVVGDLYSAAMGDDLAHEKLGTTVGHEVARRMVSAYHDKWGPAVAIRIGESQWHFCGYAST